MKFNQSFARLIEEYGIEVFGVTINTASSQVRENYQEHLVLRCRTSHQTDVQCLSTPRGTGDSRAVAEAATARHAPIMRLHGSFKGAVANLYEPFSLGVTIVLLW